MSTSQINAPASRTSKRRKVKITLTVSEDVAAALDFVGEEVTGRRADVVRWIVREHLIRRGANIIFGGFPPENSLELWVRALAQPQDSEMPPLNRNERLMKAKDGRSIIRLDYCTAG